MSSAWHAVDYSDASLLVPSSDHDSNGADYEVEPSQQDEISRQHQRRESRAFKRKRTESPPSLRASARGSKATTSELYDDGGWLDSQTSSQDIVAAFYAVAGELMHTQNQTLDPSPKIEPVELSPPGLSEVEELQTQLRDLQALRATDAGRYFTLLDRALRDRDNCRDEVRKWRGKALNTLSLLQDMQINIGGVIDKYEDAF
ncbi:hypothetical protein C8F04DRAFT_1253119 [Mycena alexandri]|uniref:Uncharacterized protein n=1 Tax=Mycena alexandri TaxID=1745969 RepID=A0AAD6TCH8_9AGAR|nr:hypothetical protein C8F04DRAFT_1253119 [Mycena alexandri]